MYGPPLQAAHTCLVPPAGQYAHAWPPLQVSTPLTFDYTECCLTSARLEVEVHVELSSTHTAPAATVMYTSATKLMAWLYDKEGLHVVCGCMSCPACGTWLYDRMGLHVVHGCMKGRACMWYMAV